VFSKLKRNYKFLIKLMNPFSIESWFGSNNINKRHNKRVMGKLLGGREAHYCRGWGTRRGALLGETRSGGTGGSRLEQRS